MAATIIQENVKGGFKYLPFLLAERKAWDKNPSSGMSFNEAVVAAMEELKAAYRQ